MFEEVCGDARYISRGMFHPLRERIGWTQKEVLELLGKRNPKLHINYSTINSGCLSKWERGVQMLDKEKTATLYRILNKHPKVRKIELTTLKSAVTWDRAGKVFQENYFVLRDIQHDLEKEHDFNHLDHIHIARMLKWLFVIYNNLPHLINHQIRNSSEAKQLIELAFPKSERARYLLRLGHAYAKQGEDDLAIELFKESIKANPNNADAYMNLGIIYQKQGEHDLEMESYKRAVEINPDAF